MINRKRMNGILSFILVCCLAFLPVFDSMATGDGTSQEEGASTEAATEAGTTTETQNGGAVDASVQKAREDAKEASDNLKSAKEILSGLKDARNSLEGYVIELDKALNEIQIEISHLEQNQKELEKSIKETKKSLKLARAAQEDQYEEMKQRIQMVYESGNKRYLDVLLTATSMTDMLNKTEYISEVSLYDYNILKELKTAKEQVANLKQKLDKDLDTNEKLQAEVNQQKGTLEDLVEEKSNQIAQYDQSIAGQEEEVQKYMQAKAEAESIIAAAEQVASSSATSIYTGGIFTWPVPGYNQITSYFGGRYAPVAGASSNHKGLDIACDYGASVVAAASGTVIVATYNYAEGNYVCIDHGGGVVTVYMHNSSLLVSAGETVSTGQPIALAGSTGISTGPHCHFGVRVDGTYVDPLGYLQ
ncbi:MAG: peptidoglycan DD-metalloendopeptidase family protein [Bacteroidales bacterium]|nr:peptidoglycan DD-metalloendopeptidase family protein [Clostridium sp.]MCM1205010.1 peptidoglycan DD-metalloendopeptidase family protein [Bacteroidales bacterium]